MVVTAVLLAFAIGSAPPPAPCDGPGADPWVADFRSRVESYDALYRFAEERYGPPVTCEGAVSMEFDGASYGSLMLVFDGGASFSSESMPPETSVTVLRNPEGFAAPELVRAALEDYADGIGLSIDWSAPEITTEAGEEVRTFWDPEPGLNASASLMYSGDSLVAVRLSMAL